MPWAPNLVPTALLRRPCSSFGHGFGTGFIQPECPWMIWERPCLSHPFSLGIPPACPWPGTQHGRCGARAPTDSRSMAHAAGGAQRRSGEKREKPNTCTQTRTGLLRLGPRRDYLPWKAARTPGPSPSALVRSTSSAAGTASSPRFGGASHPKTPNPSQGRGCAGLIFTQARLFC